MVEQDVKVAMENNQQQAIREYVRPIVNDNYFGIARPTILANNSNLTQNSNAHLGYFLEISDIVKMNGITDEAIRLHLFSFSLRDKVKAQFQSLPYGSITIWDDLAQKFFTKYFPPSKSANFEAIFVNLDNLTLNHFTTFGRDLKTYLEDVLNMIFRFGCKLRSSTIG